MPAVVLDLLKYVFLAVLYIFVWRAVRAVYLELRGTQRAASRVRRQPPSAKAPSRRSKKPARAVVVVEGDSAKGNSFRLDQELVIGRGDKCHVQLNDSYASQVHARIYSKPDGTLMIEDLGSTNGTYLNRRRITSPAELRRGDRVKIGKTVLELRK